MDKYQLAIVKYHHCQNEVKALTREIGSLFLACIATNYSDLADEHSKPCLTGGVGRKDDHDPSHPYDYQVSPYDTDGCCELCIKADRLIQHRKLARRLFGNAKAQITKLAKALEKG